MEEKNEQGEVIVDNAEATNEEVTETTEEQSAQETPKADKPKRTPQEEYDYYMGRAQRLAKKLGLEKKDEPVAAAPTKPNELDLGGIAYLNSMVGLKGKDEIALAREYISQGKDVLDLPDNKWFKQDLQSLREARESAEATPKGKGRSGQTSTTDLDVAYAKFEETGQMPDDFKTRVAIKNRLVEKSKTEGVFSIK